MNMKIRNATPVIADSSRSRLYRTRGGFALVLALVLLSLGVAPWSTPTPAPVAAAGGTVSWTYKNFTMTSYNQYDLYQSQTSLQQLVAMGATSVTFTVTWYTSGIYSPVIFRGSNTTDDGALLYAIGQAQALGLAVMLKPHLDSLDGQWRAAINPGSGAADQWFSNYTAFLDHYADIGAQRGAILLSIGAELISMSTNAAYEGRWRTLIAHERARFAGKLTYSANWGGPGFAEEWSRIPFWDALDYLGLSAYFNLSDTTTPTLADLNTTWADYKVNVIAPFQQRWGKPVLFTEGGYRSVNIAAKNPWDANTAGPSDVAQQALCYESFFETWGQVSWFAGGMFWYWKPDASTVNAGDTDYEVQGKPAYSTISGWLKTPLPTPTATPKPPTATPTAFVPVVSPHITAPTTPATPNSHPGTHQVVATPTISKSAPMPARH